MLPGSDPRLSGWGLKETADHLRTDTVGMVTHNVN